MLGYDAVKDLSVSIIKLITASNPTYHCLHLKWKHYIESGTLIKSIGDRVLTSHWYLRLQTSLTLVVVKSPNKSQP